MTYDELNSPDTEAGRVAFYDISFFCTTGQSRSFPLAVHETYKENNPQ